MSQAFVSIMMGSDKDLSVMGETVELLKQFDVRAEVKITSMHRTPERTLHYVQDAQARGCQVFICAEGLAAQLAGVVAAHTLRPVIGVPLEAGGLNGLDALLSTVQMPKGTPVATVAIGKAGATNAALLALQMLALRDLRLHDQLSSYRRQQAEDMLAKEERALEAISD